MPIERVHVRVKNFQALYDASLEVQGLTVVEGPSDMGKSSLVRALRAALFHREGSDFVSYGELAAEVSLAFKDTDGNYSIVWRKGEKLSGSGRREAVNEFVVNGALLQKVGRSQPVEVAELGFREIDYDGLKIALQFRGQRGVSLGGRVNVPFILGFSSTDADKVLSRIVQSDVYTIAARSSASELTSLRQGLNFLVEELASKTAALGRFRPLKTAESNREGLLLEMKGLEEGAANLSKLEDLGRELGLRAGLPVEVGEVPEVGVTLEGWLRVRDLSREMRVRASVAPSVPLVPRLDGGIPSFVRVKSLAAELRVRQAVPELKARLPLPASPEKFAKVRVLASELKRRSSVRPVPVTPLLPDLGLIERMREKSRELSEARRKQEELEATKRRVEGEIQRLKELLAEFEVCPLCERPLESHEAAH